MNNTIEFIVKMKNMMGGELGRLSSTAQSSFSKMAQYAQNVQDKNKVLGMSYNELSKQISQVENTIKNSNIPSQISAAKKELSELQKQATKHPGVTGASDGGSSVGMRTIAGGAILGNLATAGISAIGGGIMTAIQKSMEKETSIAGLSTFIGKQGANDAYSNIQKDAEATPFDTASLLEVNRSLISAGANAKQARTDSMNLANAIVAVGGSNDTLTRMAANMQQIKTVGKATAMDIKQFGMAGINIYAMLAKSTGKSISQVKEMDVTYNDLAKAMEMAAGKGGIYEGALDKAMNTQPGKWSNFQESVTNRLAKLGTAFAPVTNGLMDMGAKFSGVIEYAIQFVNWLQSGNDSASIFIITISTLTAGYLAYQAVIGGIAFWTGVVTKAQWLWNAAMTANPVGLVIAGVAALVVGIMVAYNKFEKFRAIVDGLWEVLKDVGSLVKAFLTGDVLSIPKLVKRIVSGESFHQGYDQSLILSKATKAKETKEKADKMAKDKASDAAKVSALAANAKLADTNDASGKAAGDTISGGGPKTINITIGKFFDNIQFTTMNGKESAHELENIVMECLSRVVYNGAKTA